MPFRPQSFGPRLSNQFNESVNTPAPAVNNKAAQAAKSDAFAWRDRQEGSPSFSQLLAEGPAGISQWMSRFLSTYEGQMFQREPDPAPAMEAKPLNSSSNGKPEEA